MSQVQAIPFISIRAKRDWGFYGHSTIEHEFDLETNNGEKVVIDHATGLMWHQAGSKEYVNWEKAKQWVNNLNNNGYAGYKDWRLPTTEEAASLLESKKRDNDLYINSIFNAEQQWIWTGDSFGSSGTWHVYFDDGLVYWNNTDVNNDNVRPVRSGK